MIFNGSTTLTGNATLNVASATNVTLTGPVSDGAASFSLTKGGAGNLFLRSANNAIDGGITITQGFLIANAGDGVLGAANSPDLKMSGGALQLRNADAALHVGLDITGNSTALQMRNDSATVFNVESVDIAAGIASFQLNSARITVGSSDLTLTLNAPVVTHGVLNMNVTGANNYVAEIGGAAAGLTLGGTLTFTPSTANLIVSAPISESGGSFGATIAGSGVVTFAGSAANTYTGQTTVNGGHLQLNKTTGVNALGGNALISSGLMTWLADEQLGNASTLTINGGTADLNGHTETLNSVIVNASSTLTGSGTLIANVNVNSGGIFTPGDSPGLDAIIGALKLAGGSILNMEFTPGGGPSDKIDVQGALDLTGATSLNKIVLNLSALDAYLNEPLTLIQFDQLLGANFNTPFGDRFAVNFAGESPLLGFDLDFVADSSGGPGAGSLVLQIGNPIPAPSAGALIGLAALGLLAVHRRK